MYWVRLDVMVDALGAIARSVIGLLELVTDALIVQKADLAAMVACYVDW